ncbi:MAG: hypothetical protein AAF571_04200 [Verrucomicrobiota bacterium]
MAEKATSAKKRPAQGASKFVVSTAFIVSVVVHLVVFLFVGSVVIFEGAIPPNLFTSMGGEMVVQEDSSEVELPPLMEEELTPEPMELVVDDPIDFSEPSIDTASMDTDLIISSVPNLTPSLNTFVPPNTPKVSENLDSQKLAVKDKMEGTGKIRLQNIFGNSGVGRGNFLTGSFYDLKQTANGRLSDVGKAYQAAENMDDKFSAYDEAFLDVIERWKPEKLSEYFKADLVLKTTQIAMPRIKADSAPEVFNVQDKVRPSGWVIHYNGAVSPPADGTYRFVGRADDVLIVNLDGEVVFTGGYSKRIDGAFADAQTEKLKLPSKWSGGQLVKGKWMRLKREKIYPIEIIVGEIPGGWFYAWLMIEEQGVDYKVTNGYPVLPLFQTSDTELPRYQPDETGPQLLEDGLVFK